MDGIDLDIERGEVFALLGPNGAGKTTTVEILEGHRRRDDGEVSVLGVDPAGAGRTWRARIGIVPQSDWATGELTVREMVAQYCAYYAVIESDPAQARKQLELVDRTARENLAEARALVAGLAPTALTSATLSDALARLTDRVGQEIGIAGEFSMIGVPASLGTGTEVVLLRVCQEALSNVRKHAKARSVRVRLRHQAEGVSLEIADDGIGFDSALVSEGFGLRGMRTRVAEIGGKLTVRSAHGEGTTVTAVLTRGDDPPEPPAVLTRGQA